MLCDLTFNQTHISMSFTHQLNTMSLFRFLTVSTPLTAKWARACPSSSSRWSCGSSWSCVSSTRSRRYYATPGGCTSPGARCPLQRAYGWYVYWRRVVVGGVGMMVVDAGLRWREIEIKSFMNSKRNKLRLFKMKGGECVGWWKIGRKKMDEIK